MGSYREQSWPGHPSQGPLLPYSTSPGVTSENRPVPGMRDPARVQIKTNSLLAAPIGWTRGAHPRQA